MADIKHIRLWDAYSALLTPTQREMTDMYLNLDLTVSEIAEAKGISRQGVSECISSAKKQLEEYEKKLRFCAAAELSEKRFELFSDAVMRWAENFKKAGFASSGMKELEEILSTDYIKKARSLILKTDKE